VENAGVTDISLAFQAAARPAATVRSWTDLCRIDEHMIADSLTVKETPVPAVHARGVTIAVPSKIDPLVTFGLPVPNWPKTSAGLPTSAEASDFHVSHFPPMSRY
jgi:hypothetical protein